MSANASMNYFFISGLLVFVISIIYVIIKVRKKQTANAIVILVTGLATLFMLSGAGTAALTKDDLHQISCRHYNTYQVNNKGIYTFGKERYSKNGDNHSKEAEINTIYTKNQKTKYHAEVVTFDLSKEQKYNWSHSFNLAKQIAAHTNQQKYLINIYK